MSSNIEIHCRSIPRSGDVQAKHARLVDALSVIGGVLLPGPAMSNTPSFSDREQSDIISLRGKLGKGVRGHLAYQNRRHIEESAQFDDHFEIELPGKMVVDYKGLFSVDIVRLASSFDAYLTFVTSEEFFLADVPGGPSMCDENRAIVARVYPANVWSSWLCKAAFGMSCKEVCDRLLGEVAYVAASKDRVVVVTEWTISTVSECVKADRRIRRMLSGNGNASGAQQL